jgi:acyl transferase domain-containing protein/thioesterase domain-containing protein/acyl carrier protein
MAAPASRPDPTPPAPRQAAPEAEGGGVDVAIVGLAAHLPGARTAAEFWENLVAGREAIRDLSDEELRAAGVAPETLARPDYVKRGSTLPDLELFDADFFGLSPKEAAIMDPQHRHFLECVWEALEDSGHVPQQFEGPVGVFAGCGMGSYFALHLLRRPDLMEQVGLFLLRHTGNDKDFLATRASYVFDLKGPSVNVQTACSTSLVAVHQACASLLAGECDLALAGGVTIELPHGQGYVFKEGEVLSSDGRVHAFDHRATGTVFGSGAAVVALRRLEDAVEDGDRIYAVIRGTAVNNDGAAKAGYLAPSVDGQAACIAEALAVAGVDADQVSYVECHGTGTAIGDPIEIAALTQAFRQTTDKRGFCGIGSVKTNIGHLDTAAGAASLIKVALALHHKRLPATLNYEAENPALQLERTPFVVQTRNEAWHGPGPRIAGVTSLGVGGTNAHVVLEEAPRAAAAPEVQRPPTGRRRLCLSAKSNAALDAGMARLAAHLKAHPELSLDDVAYTLMHGRQSFERRRVLAAATRDEAIALLESADPARVFTHTASDAPAELVFLFPGGGAQHLEMARGLLDVEPVFTEHFRRGVRLVREKFGLDLEPLLYPEADADRDALARELERPSIQLPALYVIEYALAQAWLSRGVRPSALVGHSLGENTAAAVAGVLSFEDGLGLVRLRGELFETVPPGGMLSLPMSSVDVESRLHGAWSDLELDLATVNGPELCVLSGTDAALAELERRLRIEDIEPRRIPIRIAAHSRWLEPILDEFRGYLRSIRLAAPQIPIVSNRSGRELTAAEATDPDYWVGHLRHTVRFADGLAHLLGGGPKVFLEVGPGRVLSSLARQQPGLRGGGDAFGCLPHPEEGADDAGVFEAAHARLWAAGVRDPETGEALDLRSLWIGAARPRVPLPSYAFQKQPYWIDPPTAQAESSGPRRLERFDDWFVQNVWRQRGVLEEEGPRGSRSWLVFLDGAGLGERLVQRLRGAGEQVITVVEADAYDQLDPQSYALAPEHGREGYGQLVRDLIRQGQTPQRIVHLWTLTADESFRPGSSFLHRNLERGFHGLTFLLQSLAQEEVLDALHLVTVSNGVQDVAGEGVRHPEKALALGPLRVGANEFPGLSTKHVDVDLGDRPQGWFTSRSEWEADLERLTEKLHVEVTGAASSATVALRGDRRFELGLAPAELDPSGDLRSRLERGMRVLITGGLGGVGGVLAKHLAERYGAKLALIGRRPLPERERWDDWIRHHGDEDSTSKRIAFVRELEAAGADVLALVADVTDLESMRAAVDAARTRFGGVDGVIHAAGVMDDGLLIGRTQAAADAVLAPKVHGTLVLAELLDPAELRFLLLCSSTSVAIAAPGQSDYVAANAFLDAFAAQQRRRGNVVLSLAWGIWNEVGLAARAAAGGADPESERTKALARHPFLDSLVVEADGTAQFESTWSPDEDWILDEHRTARGEALLPGTGTIELAAGALAELGEGQAFTLSDLFFFRPLWIADGESNEVRVVLRPGGAGYDLEVHSRVDLADGRIGWQRHAQGSVSLKRLEPGPSLDLRAIRERSQRHLGPDPDGLRGGQEQHLRFGPRWRVLREVWHGQGESLAQLELPAAYCGDLQQLSLHPALLDLATGFAMELVPGYDPDRGLWVPVRYEKIVVRDVLPARIFAYATPSRRPASGGFFAFDLVLTNAEGRALVEVGGFTIRHLTEELRLGEQPAPPASEIVSEGSSGVEGRGAGSSPAERRLRERVALGLRPAEGVRAFERALNRATSSHLFVSTMTLSKLVAEAREFSEQQPEEIQRFARPQLDSDYVEPRDDIERTLVGFWEELLGVDRVGVQDNFFDLGGHSLIAVRLFAQVKRTYGVDFPMSVLFEAPTVEGVARLVREAVGDVESRGDEPAPAPERRYVHLVPMHAGAAPRGGAKTPFFLVAGMFGNVLNLRHLAALIGSDRPFYGLQAKGLYGDHDPHATFEEAAHDYLAELKQVQPEGPYFLGGFSGGGITALEMAQQLLARGEEVAGLVLLDTPLAYRDPITRRDKLKIHVQRFKRQGLGYFWNWAKNRVEWELEQRRKRRETPERAPNRFHNEKIEAAFRAALERYQHTPYAGSITLFRPKLPAEYDLGGGRFANQWREIIHEDNGWRRYCEDVTVIEVPGDHDSMVLEPNVRVLAGKLRGILDRAEKALRQAAAKRLRSVG